MKVIMHYLDSSFIRFISKCIKVHYIELPGFTIELFS